MQWNSVEEEPTADAKAFYDMLTASKERLHSFTSVAQLTAVARLMAIKSQHNLSAEIYGGEIWHRFLDINLVAIPT